MFETLRQLTVRSTPVIEEALDRQADALLADKDNTQALLEDYPEAGPALIPLFGLAQRLKASLAPIEPADSFVSTLKAELIRTANQQDARLEEKGHGRKATWRAAGLLGLSLAMIVIAIRILLGMQQKRKASHV